MDFNFIVVHATISPILPIHQLTGLLALTLAGLTSFASGPRLDPLPVAPLRPGPAFDLGEPGPRPRPGPLTVSRETFVMGTRLRVTTAAASIEAATIQIEAVFAEVRRMERVLSSWRPESEVGRLNAAPIGVPVAVSAELFDLLEEARAWGAMSGGVVEPAVGALIDAWDLRGAGRRPDEDELGRARSRSGPEAFQLDARTHRVTRVAEGGWITTGSFGKGAALRSALTVLRDAGVESAFLDFGGQVVALGGSPESGSWSVSVAHPSRRDQPAAELRLANVSASTSGASERFVEVDGQRFGHILDPRSGRPVPAWGSATVVAADPMVADLVSTAVFVLGPEAGLRWAESLDEIGVLVLHELDGRLTARWNPAMERWLLNGNEDRG